MDKSRGGEATKRGGIPTIGTRPGWEQQAKQFSERSGVGVVGERDRLLSPRGIKLNKEQQASYSALYFKREHIISELKLLELKKELLKRKLIDIDREQTEWLVSIAAKYGVSPEDIVFDGGIPW